MKLWLLRPVNDLKPKDNPWDHWYNKAFGFVVRAETEEIARQYAHANAGDENRGEFLSEKIANTKQPWIDPLYTTCVELVSDGIAGVVITDFKPVD